MPTNRTITAAVALATMLAAGCAEPVPDAEPEPEPAEFAFCELLDLDLAAHTARELDVPQADTGELRRILEQVDTEGPPAELCHYGDAVEEGRWYELLAHPGGWPDGQELPDGAQPRPDLGEHAYFWDESEVRNTLAAPAGDAFLELTLIVGQSIEEPDRGPAPEEIGPALAELLAGVDDQVPAGARLRELAAGEHCQQFTEAATATLGGLDYSRQVEVDGAHACTFSDGQSGRSVSIGERPGMAEPFEGIQGTTATEVPGVEDAWQLQSGSVYVFAGPDLVILRVSGAEDQAERELLRQELAAAAVPVITGAS